METDQDEIFHSGWTIGRNDGYTDGWNDCEQQYETRLKKYWAELAELNARIDYLYRFTGASND